MAMSKAFTKEDDALPERSARKRVREGLPPGAVNYMTAAGAHRLRAELATMKGENPARATEIERILASATIVQPPLGQPEGAVFGARVTVRDSEGRENTHRIVGVDELGLEPDSVTWISQYGRALLGTEPGQRVTLEVNGECRSLTVVRVEY